MYDNNLFSQTFEKNFNIVFKIIEFNNSNDDFCSDSLNLYPNIPEENTIENLSTNVNTNNLNENTESEKKTIGKKRRIDNIIYKFKTKFFQNYLIGICNKLIEKYSPNETKRFKKVKHKIISILNITPNLNLLSSPLTKFLSYDISDMYKNCDKKNNENLANEYSKFNKYFKRLFEYKIESLYKIFINDNCKNINKNKFTIESDLSLNYFLNEIDNIKRKEKTEIKWKDIYSFFSNKKTKSQKEDFH